MSGSRDAPARSSRPALPGDPARDASFLWLVVLYGWQTRGHVTPWLFTDELKLTQISRSISETGHAAQRGARRTSFQTLYAYVLAPFWKIGDVATAYAAIKYVGVVVMTSAIFPAYFLARMIVSRPWALFAAVGAVADARRSRTRRSSSRSPLAYPWATLCLFLIAKALATRGTRWCDRRRRGVRSSLPSSAASSRVLIPVYALAALFLALDERRRAKRWRQTWSVVGLDRRDRPRRSARSSSSARSSARTRRRGSSPPASTGTATIVYGLWAAGAFTIGLGAAAGRRAGGARPAAGRAVDARAEARSSR